MDKIKRVRNEFIRRRMCVLINDWKETQKSKGEPGTDRDFAAAIGVVRSAITKYKAGKAVPSDKVLRRICDTFQIPEKYFDPVAALELTLRDLKQIENSLRLILSTNYKETMEQIIKEESEG